MSSCLPWFDFLHFCFSGKANIYASNLLERSRRSSGSLPNIDHGSDNIMLTFAKIASNIIGTICAIKEDIVNKVNLSIITQSINGSFFL